MMNAARLLLARRLVVPPTMVTLGGGTVAVAAVAAYQIESDNINNNNNDKDDSIKNLRWRTTAASSSSLLLFSKMMQVLPVAHAKEAAPTPPPPAAAAATVDLTKVRQALVSLMDDDEEKRGDGTSLRGTMIRLAWHASGTFSKEDNSGGSNGARMRFDPEASWGANAGLHVARQALEPIHQQFPNMSYADLYTYAGVVAIEESGGPTIPFRLGRVDMDSGATSPPDGRLPDADKGSRDKNIQHIRDVFTRMGFTDREMVALLGAHSMGRCHTDRSGYWGPWTFGETTFSNEYFRLLTEERWSPKLVHDGKVWTGPEQYEDSTGKLMMLPSDIALVQDPTLKQYVELYAKDDQVFFQDFAQAFGKLLELGVPSFGGGETTTPPQGRKGFFAWLKGESGRN